MRYEEAKSGDWVEPIKKGYRLACCDCGLVHVLNFEVNKKDVRIQFNRDEKATKAMRRNKKHKNQKL